MSEREMRTLLAMMLVGLAGAWKPVVSAAETPPPPQRIAEDAALVLYVDANHGNDGKDGLSPQVALRTLNAAQAAMDKVPEGDRVILMLARGSVWREMSGRHWRTTNRCATSR